MNHSDLNRNAAMLCGPLAKRGYLRWWHSFTGLSSVTGRERTFFVEYLILNPVPGRSGAGKSRVPSYVRVMAGSYPNGEDEGICLHACYPIRTARYAKKPLYFQVEDNILRENRITGYLEVSPREAGRTLSASDAGTLEWDLEVYKNIACHTGAIASPFFSAVNALDSFWHGEGIRTEYRGNVVLNGECYEVVPETSFGYADKHWGRSYNQPWLQLSSCSLYSQRSDKILRHSALAIDGCCPRFLFFRLKPRLMLQLTYTGEDFCYSFARPLSLSRLKWCTRESQSRFTWRVKAQNRSSMIKLSLHCSKGHMLHLEYEDPDSPGECSRYRTPPLWSGGDGAGTIELYRLTPGGREWIDTLTVQHALCSFRKAPSR